eukprot:6870037-Prymnesium_polylepis.1
MHSARGWSRDAKHDVPAGSVRSTQARFSVPRLWPGGNSGLALSEPSNMFSPRGLLLEPSRLLLDPCRLLLDTSCLPSLTRAASSLG